MTLTFFPSTEIYYLDRGVFDKVEIIKQLLCEKVPFFAEKIVDYFATKKESIYDFFEQNGL